MAGASDIGVYLSGGAGNTDPNASLGGAMSSTALSRQTAARQTSSITGVVINAADCCLEGTGVLSFVAAGSTLSWQTPFGAVGAAVDVSAGGDFTLQDSTGTAFLEVTVTAANLPASDQSDNIDVSNVLNNLYDDIDRQESKDGDDEYRCIYIVNGHGSDSMDLSVYFKNQSTGADNISIALDSGGKNAQAVVVANEGDEPAGGLSWGSPSTKGTGLTITLLAGEWIAIWFRRIVPIHNQDDASGAHFDLLLDISP